MAGQLSNVRHDYIRYANCWEDADILLEGLNIQPNDRILSIGSAGDNSFSLLLNDPELVVAVDINSAQINLIELKKAAFQALDYDELLLFLGFNICSKRKALFNKIRDCLPMELQSYWQARIKDVESGIIHQGKFERYFQLFRNRILPLIHTSKCIEELFKAKSSEQQKEFHTNTWNNWRWKTLFKVFFSNYVMGKFGRDPEFLKEVKIPVSSFILHQAEKHLSSVNCQRNHFLHYIMKGNFGATLPHYIREENHRKIKANIDRLVVFNGLAEETFKVYANFNKFNLSNIFEYMDTELFQAVSTNLVDNGADNARYVYWNLMVPRNMSAMNEVLKKNQLLSKQLTDRDKGFFYSNINVDIKI